MSKRNKEKQKLRERQIPRYHEVESIETIIYRLFTTGLDDTETHVFLEKLLCKDMPSWLSAPNCLLREIGVGGFSVVILSFL